MIRRLLPATIALVGIAVTSIAAVRAPRAATDTVTLRVNSTSAQPTAFRGVYLFQGDSLVVLQRSTPFEITGNGPLAHGIFERDGAGAQLLVEIYHRPDHRASVTGNRVMVGKDLLNGELFSRGY